MQICTTDMLLGKKEKDELTIKANQHGWVVVNTSPMTFNKGIISIWYCKNFWQCADMIKGHFRNHRSYSNVITALEKE